MTKRPAVFLDRDGTIIEDVGYLSDPDEVKLLPGAAAAINRLAEAGFAVVIISNQSGVARGFFDEQQMNCVHEQLESLLSQYGAKIDGAYYCPYLDSEDATVEAFRRDSDLRKPKPGMILQAGEELEIDLPASWMIGDAQRDVEAGRRAGCQTILLGPGGSAASANGSTDFVAANLAKAVDLVERERVAGGKDSSHRKAKPSSADLGESSEVKLLLERILLQLESSNRHERQQDFSVLRLLGSLMQMFAIVAALWGTLNLFDGSADFATAKLTLACFLQIASVSAFAVDRFR